MARYHACKCPTPVRWSRPNVAVSDGIGRIARVPSTMLASVDTIIESVGGPTPDVISVDTDAHQILATKVNSRAFLVVIAPKKVSRAVVRRTMRGLNARLAAAASKSTHLHIEETEKQRVNVRPPR